MFPPAAAMGMNWLRGGTDSRVNARASSTRSHWSKATMPANRFMRSCSLGDSAKRCLNQSSATAPFLSAPTCITLLAISAGTLFPAIICSKASTAKSIADELPHAAACHSSWLRSTARVWGSSSSGVVPILFNTCSEMDRPISPTLPRLSSAVTPYACCKLAVMLTKGR